MNKLFSKLVCSLFVCLILISSGLNAQNDNSSSDGIQINKEMKIELNASSELQESYILDISELNFVSEDAASKYFYAINDNLLRYHYNKGEKTVKIELMTQFTGPEKWSIVEWNQYFEGLVDRYSTMFDRVNK